MYWANLLKEVLARRATGRKFSLAGGDEQNQYCGSCHEIGQQKTLKAYSLGGKYESVYFTRREAECMACLLRGKTVGNVAAALKLSPRTVEYYIKNMKSKLGCRTKFELIDLVFATDFEKNIDFV